MEFCLTKRFVKRNPSTILSHESRFHFSTGNKRKKAIKNREVISYAASRNKKRKSVYWRRNVCHTCV